MLTQVSRLEHVIDGKVFHFYCEQNIPTEMAKQALFEYLKLIGKIEDAHKEMLEAKKKEEAEKASQSESQTSGHEPINNEPVGV